VQITGIAYEAAYGSTVGVDTTTWILPTDPVPMTVELDLSSPIGTATLTLDGDNNLVAVCTITERFRHWANTRPYLAVGLDAGTPPTVTCIGLSPATDDPGQPGWTED
jgi:hypothetical protein